MSNTTELDELIPLLKEFLQGSQQEPVAASSLQSAEEKIEQVKGLVDTIKDNIAYIVGLPAMLGGSFGFLWETSGDSASMEYQIEQLEIQVAEMQAETSLLGDSTKNFAIDMSAAPGGSLTWILMLGAAFATSGALLFYQSRRKKQKT